LYSAGPNARHQTALSIPILSERLRCGY
jgi:hypothetical protein